MNKNLRRDINKFTKLAHFLGRERLDGVCLFLGFGRVGIGSEEAGEGSVSWENEFDVPDKRLGKRQRSEKSLVNIIDVASYSLSDDSFSVNRQKTPFFARLCAFCLGRI